MACNPLPFLQIYVVLEATEKLLRDPGAELVFALVGPVGADLATLETDLCDQLRQYGYGSKQIRLSELLRRANLGSDLKEFPEAERLNSYMDAGNLLRERSSAGEILALWAITEIKAQRSRQEPVQPRTAYILRSIKHPDEARALRAVYGPGFFLIGLSASTRQKLRHLQQRGLTNPQAHQLIDRDAGEANDFGQKTRDAFELADVFIRQEDQRPKTTDQVKRFLRLIFGAIDETPTRHEHAMFMAYAASLTSADLSRQVGAVVWKDGIGVVATGCNDVPAPGGGLYWPDSGADHRDHAKGHDANVRHRNAILNQIAESVKTALGLSAEQLQVVREACNKTRFPDITEFGRAAHAEMDALLSCARAGISTKGATLFSTTFPCHNCAKHIIGAGIARVVYIEPYEKSQALDLHDDAILIDDQGDFQEQDVCSPQKVIFQAFVGVGPRRFFDLFSMKLSNGFPMRRKTEDGQKSQWTVNDRAVVRVPMLPTSYLDREAQFAQIVTQLLEPSENHEDQN